MLRRAFTLVELLVVIAIIGLLSTVAVVATSAAREKARIAKGLQHEATVYRAVGDDVVGQWDLNDCSGTAASDSGGNGQSGTLTGGAAWSTNTPSGQGCSISLNGSTAYVAIPYFNPNSSSLVYSAWFNTSSSASQNLISLRGTLLRVSSTTIDWWTDVLIARAIISKPISLNAWHHIVVDQNGTNYAVYLDGALAGSGTAAGPINNSSFSNAIGMYNAGGAYFSGLVDNVRFYARSLTAREVWKQYADGREAYLAAVGNR